MTPARFSSVDTSPDPDRLVRFLDAAAQAESGIKHYAAAAHARRHPAGPILDVGSGAGHDLDVLASFGLTAVGLEPSAVMLAAATERAGGEGHRFTLVRGDGTALPFGNATFAGCRIERVLMHVDDPAVVLAEAVRCVVPGGLVTAFEPDWGRFEVRSDVLSPVATWINTARHPAVGGRLWDLIEDAGCDVLDRVEELSVWRSLATLALVTGFPGSVDRAVALGRLEPEPARRWVEEQNERDAAGSFRAALPKILVVARKR